MNRGSSAVANTTSVATTATTLTTHLTEHMNLVHRARRIVATTLVCATSVTDIHTEWVVALSYLIRRSRYDSVADPEGATGNDGIENSES